MLYPLRSKAFKSHPGQLTPAWGIGSGRLVLKLNHGQCTVGEADALPWCVAVGDADALPWCVAVGDADALPWCVAVGDGDPVVPLAAGTPPKLVASKVTTTKAFDGLMFPLDFSTP